MRPRILRAGALLPALLMVWSCAGEIDGGSGSDPTKPAPTDPRGAAPVDPSRPPLPVDPSRPPVAACAGAPRVGNTPFRLLTNEQYGNAIKALLSPLDPGDPTAGFAADSVVGGFKSNAEITISDLQFEKYQLAADRAADQAVANLAMVLGCATQDDACASAFIQDFGRRAWRRPLAVDETRRLVALYGVGKQGDGFANGIRLAISALLQSPYFLYHVDAGLLMPGSPTPMLLGGYDLAARMAFFLWNSIPDRTLLDAAGAGRLGTREGVVAEATRMLGDPKATGMLLGFHRQWLLLEGIDQLEKDRKMFPTFGAPLASAMRGEFERFIEYVLRQGDGKLGTLLTGGFTFATAPLFALYGVADPGASAPTYGGYRRVDFANGQRAGLLTQAGFLAMHAHPNQTSPVFRGKVVREQLLCQSLPLPPAAAADTAPGLDPRLSTKERFARHRTDPACTGCHLMMDPIGLGLENYDAIGKYQEVEPNGARIDPSGELVAAGDASGAFRGGIELSSKLASSLTVRQCVSAKWLGYALGRVASADDECSKAELDAVLGTTGNDIRQLLLAVTRSDALRYSRSADGR